MYLSAVPIRTPLTPSKCLDGSRFSDSLKIAFDDFSEKRQISFREVADDGSTTKYMGLALRDGFAHVGLRIWFRR